MLNLFSFKNTLEFEKRSVFLINFIFVLIVIFSLVYDISLKYFFYFNIILTLFLSYIFFKRSKTLARALIVTNLFIFFYFLYPSISWFFSELFGGDSYIFIIFYNIIVAYLFLYFSGYKDNLLGKFEKFNITIFLIILMIGFVFGLLFNLIKEPVPSMFVSMAGKSAFQMIFFLMFSSFVVAVSEQMIFSGFLFNTYRKLSSKYDAFYQVSLIFVLFHLLRFDILIKYYYVNFQGWYVFFILIYYLLLFVFMSFALYFYSFKYHKYEGNFLYPVALHFAADFGLFLFYIIGTG